MSYPSINKKDEIRWVKDNSDEVIAERLKAQRQKILNLKDKLKEERDDNE